jgi:HK97 family phage major capsid protein
LIGPATTGGDAQWLGYPVHFCQVMPVTTAANKCCYFGDFMGATMIGERRDLTIASSEHSAFLSDAMVYRATARAAINIHGDGKGSTVGPVFAMCGT